MRWIVPLPFFQGLRRFIILRLFRGLPDWQKDEVIELLRRRLREALDNVAEYLDSAGMHVDAILGQPHPVEHATHFIEQAQAWVERARAMLGGDCANERCIHPMGWHRKNVGACIECACLEYEGGEKAAEGNR